MVPAAHKTGPPERLRPYAERILWQALTRDRRFAGHFKRQTPVGRHIPDFVSFVHRLAIELVNPGETEAILTDRATRRAWLESRNYRVIDINVGDVERDLGAELERLGQMISEASNGHRPASTRRNGKLWRDIFRHSILACRDAEDDQ
jgi:very-short-patch-repair endonuclease